MRIEKVPYYIHYLDSLIFSPLNSLMWYYKHTYISTNSIHIPLHSHNALVHKDNASKVIFISLKDTSSTLLCSTYSYLFSKEICSIWNLTVPCFVKLFWIIEGKLFSESIRIFIIRSIFFHENPTASQFQILLRACDKQSRGSSSYWHQIRR